MRHVSDALVFFGATGDLARKQIFPALQALVRRAGLDGGVDRPAPFAGVGDLAAQAVERGVARERGAREVEQPRADHAAVTP